MLNTVLYFRTQIDVGGVKDEPVSADWNATPQFSFCLSTQDPNFRVSPRPVFRGAGGDPALQHAAPLRPVREQWGGRGGDFSFCSDLIFSPTELFLPFYALGAHRSSSSGALVLSRPQISSSSRCDSVAMDWFQCFSSDLCLDQVEKTVCVTCGSLSSYMFHPASFKSTWLPMFLHILGLWTFLPPLCISRRRPGIVRISFFFLSFFLKSSPGFLKPAKIYSWKVMAERGALSLLSLLCLTSLYTETTAAKHVDKGKTLTDTAAVLMCVCGFTPRSN